MSSCRRRYGLDAPVYTFELDIDIGKDLKCLRLDSKVADERASSSVSLLLRVFLSLKSRCFRRFPFDRRVSVSLSSFPTGAETRYA